MTPSLRARIGVTLGTFLLCCSILMGFPIPTGSWARASTTWSELELDAFDNIHEVETFRPYGFPWDRSPRVMRHTVYLLLHSKQSAKIFKIALAESPPEGKAYALLGLSIADKPYYQSVKGRYAKSTQEVQYGATDLVETTTMGEVVEWIDRMPSSRSPKLVIRMAFPDF